MELLIPLDNRSRKPLYEQIYSYIRKEIRTGGLKTADRLPSTRVLAEHLKVSRSTTQMAYDQLLAEGYIEALPCRGYFVAQMEALVEVAGPQMQAGEESEAEKSPWLVDFSPRGIDLDSFPYPVWRKLSRNALADQSRELLHAGCSQGEPKLREAIRSYLHSARGVNCSADQIIIGAGNEYLLMLMAQILGPRCRVAMENPTYKQAYRVFQGLGYPVVPVSMDSQGMEVEALERSGADVAYVMPSHQFPMGIVMPVGRRQELLRWAGEGTGRYLIEDDYDSEFRYKGKPVPALQGMDSSCRVIYLGTFSRCIAPAIRVSYLVLPPQLLACYRERVSFYASTVSRIDQEILYHFLADGYFERHLNRTRGIYKAKHDMLLAQIRPLERSFLIRGEYAGTHILLTHRGGCPEDELTRLAAASGVRVHGLGGYEIGGECGGESGGESGGEAGKPSGSVSSTILLGYASLSEQEICLGAGRLIEAWGRRVPDTLQHI